jgi:hypothetical protein
VVLRVRNIELVILAEGQFGEWAEVARLRHREVVEDDHPADVELGVMVRAQTEKVVERIGSQIWSPERPDVAPSE